MRQQSPREFDQKDHKGQRKRGLEGGASFAYALHVFNLPILPPIDAPFQVGQEHAVAESLVADLKHRQTVPIEE